MFKLSERLSDSSRDGRFVASVIAKLMLITYDICCQWPSRLIAEEWSPTLGSGVSPRPCALSVEIEVEEFGGFYCGDFLRS